MRLYVNWGKEKECLVEALLQAYSKANIWGDHATKETVLKLLNRIEKCEKMQKSQKSND